MLELWLALGPVCIFSNAALERSLKCAGKCQSYNVMDEQYLENITQTLLLGTNNVSHLVLYYLLLFYQSINQSVNLFAYLLLYLSIYLSPGVILCGRLGSKHQLSIYLPVVS